VKRAYVDVNFTPDVFNGLFVQELSHKDILAAKPERWDVLIKMARDLSKPFPTVRADLYETNGHPLFGELTFTPHGCIHDYMNIELQRYLGGMAKIGEIRNTF
jgi:hypothetical protein